MMAHQITLIPGDGIGPEVADATVRAVDATGVAIEWERVEAGVRALAEQGQLIPDDVFASLEMTRVGLKGPTATPIGGGHQSINVALRKKLGLYTNFRPVRMLPGLKTRFHDLALDLAIFRENTEDLYSGLEHEVVPGVVESLKIITQKASTQDRARRLRMVAPREPQEGDGHPQGQHHEVERRPVSEVLPRSGRRIFPISSTTN